MRRISVLVCCSALFTSHITSSEPIIKLARISGLAEQIVGETLIYEIYKSAGIDVQIASMPGKRASLESANRNKDGEMLRIWSYGEQNKHLIRIPTPIAALKTQPFAHTDFQFDAAKKNQYSYAIVRGVQHTKDATANFQNVKEMVSATAMMVFLGHRRADIALSSKLDGQYQIKLNRIENVSAIDKVWQEQPLYHYIHEDYSHLVPTLDKAILRMKANGELERLWDSTSQQLLNQN